MPSHPRRSHDDDARSQILQEMSRRRTLLLSIVCGLSILDSCSPTPKDPVIARVGTVELTRTEAWKNIDTTRRDIEGQIAAYATSWVNEELLYQEAKRNGFESSPQVIEMLSRTRRQLAGQAYLRKVLDADTTSITDQMIEDYYHTHAAEFNVAEDMLRLTVATFVVRDRATTFSAALAKGESWDRAVKAALADSASTPANLILESPRYYSQRAIYPVELWRVAVALNAGEASFPVKLPQGYAVVQLLSRAKSGSTAPLEMVKDEVRQRIQIMNGNLRYRELLGTLRKRYTVEVQNGVRLPDDTSGVQAHE